MSRKNSKIHILDAALRLITRRGGADVTMGDIARAARLSRQAVYLHFADRGDLFLALVRHVDNKMGLEGEVRKIVEAPTGIEAVRAMVSLQARRNPDLWAVARAMDAVRRSDDAVERGWQDRLRYRLEGCRQMIGRIENEAALRPGLDPALAADLLWTITSLRMWEDLVIQRQWTAAQYEERVFGLLVEALTVRGPER
jgi:AcrR family transcriptional regulator